MNSSSNMNITLQENLFAWRPQMKKTTTLLFTALVVTSQIFLSSLNNALLGFNSNSEKEVNIENERQRYSALKDRASEEWVIGVSNMTSKNYRNLMVLISKYEGNVHNYISFKKRVQAIAVSLPLPSTPSFIKEAEAIVAPDYIEPNVQFRIDLVPNDLYWSVQWGPKKIKADYAWNTTIGNSSLVVAVIDTGVDWNHPDLAANYAPLGYDWVNLDPDPMDDNGHGTHVAGIIGAIINNSIGIAGISQVKIMAEKGLNQNGVGYEDDLANAIVHAVDQGAKIINMSWGDYTNSSLIQQAIRYAYNSGVLLVAAAGNDATSQKLYPAAYNEVIAVSATDQSDNPAWFTNYGDWIELAAPGVDIFSTLWDNTYGYKSGTSMATPHVSSVAALIWSSFPVITRDQLRTQLHYSADDLGTPEFDPHYGYGRVDAMRALVIHNIAVTNVSSLKTVVGQGFTARIDVNVTNKGNNVETFNLTLYANTTVIQTRVLTSAAGNFTVQSFTWNTAGFAEGNYTVSAYAWPVPSEIYIADNTYYDGRVLVTIQGDVNGDKKVDGKDIAIVAKAFGKSIGQPGYVPNADVNSDGKIDGKDIAVAAKFFGKVAL